MDKKTQQILLFAGVGILAYMWWKKSQNFSGASGNGFRGLSKLPFCLTCNCNQFTCIGCDKCKDRL